MRTLIELSTHKREDLIDITSQVREAVRMSGLRPKGLVEPSETPLETAIQETREETSIDDLTFDWAKSTARLYPMPAARWPATIWQKRVQKP